MGRTRKLRPSVSTIARTSNQRPTSPHVVVSAKVRTSDGRWFALDGRYLKRKQRAMGGLYQSVLRAELSHRYGVAWGPIVEGQAEIVGMPAELLTVFSKRTTQVDAALAEKVNAFREREGRDPTRWERAALTRQAAADSRPTKTGAAIAELVRTWSEEAAELGWTASRVVGSMQAAARQASEPEAVTVAQVVEQLSTTGSTWTRADVLQAVCDVARPVSKQSGQRWAAALEAATDRVVGHCTSVDPPDQHSPKRASDGRSIWLAPVEPHLTSEAILAQEEHILAFALDAHTQPPRPSATVERKGLDVLQGDAAAAVAGHEPLVLIVGPAGTGKTTMLRRGAEDLGRHGRPMFGIAPTAKAVKVLQHGAGIPAATVAKLLWEWRHGRPVDPSYDLPAGTTVVADEAGMIGTGSLDALLGLAVSQHWRLVLVGDPRQLQAVGRGGMFDQLCRTVPAHELATIHRFRHRWEQTATRQLRTGNPAALDAYLSHDRISAGTLPGLLEHAAWRSVEEAAAGRSVAVTAETNEHVAMLNRAIQRHRRAGGDLGEHTVRIAGGAIAAVGDIVVTRRNARDLLTDGGEPVRNRDRWVVTAVGRDGTLTVSHLHGHGTVTLPGDYVRAQVQLGYAATAHGHQGDTLDASLTLVTTATTHRSLYVGATRGRDDNHLLVVTDNEDPAEARDVLERVLTNERADVPAVSQRRRLAHQHHDALRPRSLQQQRADALAALSAARRAAEPHLDAVRQAQAVAATAASRLRAAQAAVDAAPRWRRRKLAEPVREWTARLAVADEALDHAISRAEPHVTHRDEAERGLDEIDRQAAHERIKEQLRALDFQRPVRSQEGGVEIDVPRL